MRCVMDSMSVAPLPLKKIHILTLKVVVLGYGASGNKLR